MSTADPTSARGKRTKVERGIYKRNGRYQVVVSQNGRTVSKMADTLSEARAERGLLVASRHKGESVIPARVTLAEAMEQFFERRPLEPQTERKYRFALSQPAIKKLHERKLSSITTDDVAAVVRELGRTGRKGSTVKAMVIPLSAVFTFGVRRQWARANPVVALERDERPVAKRRQRRVLSPDEIQRVIAAAGERWTPLIGIATFAGPRLSECLGLVWKDVDLQAGVVHIRRQLGAGTTTSVDTKTDAGVRTIPLAPSLVSVLRRHQIKARFSLPHHPVFAGASGTPVGQRYVQEVWEKIRKDAKLDEPMPRFHDLRHTAASIFIADSEGDVVYVSRCLGHASPSMTLDVYADLFDQVAKTERVRERIERRAAALLGAV